MVRSILIASMACLAALVSLPLANADFCSAASGCEFWDSSYHEYILYNIDTPKVDVLIVPPVSGLPLSDLAAIQGSVQAWEDGINSMAPAWLASGLNIHAYTLGVDTPPQDALTDPEIIIATANHDPAVLFGIGEQVPFSVCRQQAAADHVHDGATLKMMRCDDGGAQCIVLNTNWLLGTAHDMYDLNAHEFGHCLGIGHVGDALDFDAKTVPTQDIMSYQTTPSQVHCVSNLNIQALEGVYATVLGQSGQLNAGDFIQMTPSSYTQTSCANPSEDILGGLGASSSASTPLVSEPLPVDVPISGLMVSAWDPTALLSGTPLVPKLL
jgi:hypothetical protein